MSGLHDGVLWTVNDSGGDGLLYAIGDDGSTLATVRLTGIQARDWESLAVADLGAGPELWVADIGDNRGSRDQGVLVHRLAEPAELADTEVEVRASYRLRYPDAPVDAEAIAVDAAGQRLLVVTKALFGAVAYAAPLPLDPAGPTTLEQVGVAPTLVTGAAALPDGSVALVTYASVYVGTPEAGWGDPAPIPPLEQAESLAAGSGGQFLYVGSEGEGAPIWRLPVPAVAAGSPSSRYPTAAPSRSTPATTSSAPTARTPASPAEPPGAAPAGGGSALPVVALLGLGAAAVVAVVLHVVRRRH